MDREAVRFRSGDDECAAWYYPSRNGACVVMAAGFGVPKEPGTDRFAQRFHAAGFGVLAFDYRRLGESGGTPRLVLPLRDAVADWAAATRCAATLPGVDPERIGLWGFSLSGGHVVLLAARAGSRRPAEGAVAAVIAQSPTLDGRAATRNALRHQRPGALLRTLGRGVRDAVGGLLGRAPVLLPLTGEPGQVALLTTPDARDGARALDPQGRFPQWQQAVAARSALALGSYRPLTRAQHVDRPLLVVVADDDRTALAAPGVEAARRAPRGELVRVPGGHYAPFQAGFETVVTAELEFLARHLLAGSEVRPGVAQ